MDRSQMSNLIEVAVAQVIHEDIQLLELDVCERALQFRLAHYIAQSHLIVAPLTVDCEYNRHFRNEKKLLLPRQNKESSVFPDILIHERDSDEHNELVLELKKPGEPLEADREKLEAFVHQIGYRHAVQLVLGNDRFRGTTSQIHWVT